MVELMNSEESKSNLSMRTFKEQTSSYLPWNFDSLFVKMNHSKSYESFQPGGMDKHGFMYVMVIQLCSELHWLFIISLVMLVTFFMAHVYLILMRIRTHDYTKHAINESGAMDNEPAYECGWKRLHEEVFRPPPHLALLTSLVGTGMQLLFVLTISALPLYAHAFIYFFLIVFVVSYVINGLIGGSLYARMSGKHWIRQLVISATLLPLLGLVSVCFIEVFSVLFDTGVPFSFILIMEILLTLEVLIIVFNLLGTLMGRYMSAKMDFPCRTGPMSTSTPTKKCFIRPMLLIILSEILPYSFLLIDLHFIYTWIATSHKDLIFSFTLSALFLLIVATSSITISAIYLFLNFEDHRWQWTSFLSGASISIYTFIYLICYCTRMKICGTLEITYVTLLPVCFGIICGSVSYMATSRFVRKIFSTVKFD